MTLNNLTEEETEVVFQCLRCVAAGDVIFNNWEFSTLFGITFAKLEEIVRGLPDIDESDEEVEVAITGSLNHLLGYPHGRDALWLARLSVPKHEVERIFAKWRSVRAADYLRSVH